MKKNLLLLFVCLFGALSGVKAYNFATPEAGKSYYLLNVAKKTFWYASTSNINPGGDERHYGLTSDLSKANPVYIESKSGNTTALTYNLDDTKYYLYANNKGNVEMTTSSNTMNVETNSGAYCIVHRYGVLSARRMHADSNTTCNFPEGQPNNDHRWQFIPVDDIANYLAEVVETNYVSGWERVTSVNMLKAHPENYFFAIFSANAAGLMVRTNAAEGQGYYINGANPLSNSAYLFGIENYRYNDEDYFVMKAENTNGYYYPVNDAACDLFAPSSKTAKDAACRLTFEYANANDAWSIKTWAEYAGGSYWGLWFSSPSEQDYRGYKEGQKMAGNKTTDYKGSFLIYRKLKKNADMTSFIANPSFETPTLGNSSTSNDLYGWTTNTAAQEHFISNKNASSRNFSGVDGNNLFNTWGSTDGNGFYVEQTITNLPVGYYQLTCYVASDNNNTVRVALGNEYKDITTVGGGTGVLATVKLYKTTAGDATIRVSSNTWFKTDNFHLTLVDGVQDLTPVGGLMNADVNTAQQNAVNNYNSNKTAANYIAATEAIAAAEVSKAAYAQIKSSDLTAYRTKIGNVLTKTNVYTTEAYNKWYANVQDNYNNGVYTNEEVVTLTENGAYNSEWHSSNQIDDILMSTWDEVPMNWGSYHINTWSGEGSEDGSGFLVPFFEYWVASGGVLAAKTMTSTVTGLDANTEYSVNIWARVRQTDNQSKVAGSITMQVGSGLTVDLTTGSQVGSTQFYLNHFTATGSTNGEGQLTITINVAANSNISWLSFKDVAISKQAASGDVQTYSGLINENVVVTPTVDYPIVNISGASFTGTLTANFTSDQNGFIIATAEQKAALGDVKNVVVGNTCDNLVLTDGVKAVIPAALTQATSATYSRTIAAASNYGTICLPYAVKSDDDIQYYTVDQIVGNVLKLTEAASVEAGKPAIFKKKNGEATNITAAASNVAVTDDAGVEASLVGTFERLAVGDEESSTGTAANKYYYIKNNEFVQGLDYFYINPFRAYIDTNDYSEKPARLVIDTDGATAISELKTLDEKQGLKDGKYLIGGKVIVVKAGKQFNVNGVLK